jgi:transposase
MDYEILRNQLKLMKINGGISYKAIAEQSGVSYGVIRNFVSGYCARPNEENCKKLQAYFDKLARQNITFEFK